MKAFYCRHIDTRYGLGPEATGRLMRLAETVPEHVAMARNHTSISYLVERGDSTYLYVNGNQARYNTYLTFPDNARNWILTDTRGMADFVLFLRAYCRSTTG